MMKEKILRGIIQDLMKVPMSHEGHDGMESHDAGAPDMEGMEPKSAHVEIEAVGKPKDMASALDPDKDDDMDSMKPMKPSGPIHSSATHKMQMKKLHSMKK